MQARTHPLVLRPASLSSPAPDAAQDSAAVGHFPACGSCAAPLTHCLPHRRQEYACTAVDVLARRTRIAFLDANAAVECLPRVIELMARELKWSSKRKEQVP